MIAGRELDALVAEKVMGWRRHSITVGGGPMSYVAGDSAPHAICLAALKACSPK